MSSQHQRAKLKYWGAPVPGHLKHGSGTRAARAYGCDCKLCLPSGRRRAANGEGLSATERSRRLRASKAGKAVPPGMKHGIYAYKVYGCRCDICAQRKIRENRKHKKTWAWLKTATGHYAFTKSVVTIHWPPVGHGVWTCPGCGQQFPHRAPKEARLAA